MCYKTQDEMVSGEVSLLIQKAIEYTKSRHGDNAGYIFVDEKDISRPLQFRQFDTVIMPEHMGIETE